MYDLSFLMSVDQCSNDEMWSTMLEKLLDSCNFMKNFVETETDSNILILPSELPIRRQKLKTRNVCNPTTTVEDSFTVELPSQLPLPSKKKKKAVRQEAAVDDMLLLELPDNDISSV